MQFSPAMTRSRHVTVAVSLLGRVSLAILDAHNPFEFLRAIFFCVGRNLERFHLFIWYEFEKRLSVMMHFLAIKSL